MFAQASTVFALLATAGVVNMTLEDSKEFTPTRNVIPSWERRLDELDLLQKEKSQS
jgi:hypothetical protein